MRHPNIMQVVEKLGEERILRLEIEQQRDELLSACKLMTELCRIKYGNRDKAVYDAILEIEKLIENVESQ